MSRTFVQQDFIAYDETAIKHVLHMVETDGSVVLNIYLVCCAVKLMSYFYSR